MPSSTAARVACRVQRVFDASLLFLHLDFGGGTDLDDGHAAGQLGHALLQLLAVVVAGGFLDLHAHLLDAGFDVGGSAGAVDDGGVFLAHFDALGLAEVGQRDLLEGQADFFGDDLAAGQDGDVFEHGLAAVTEARGLDGDDLQDAADGVDHQGREGFAFDFLGDDQQRPAGLGDLFQHRQQVADVADLLVEQQDERVVQQGGLLVRVVDEVGRQVAAVELHAFDDFELALERLAVFDGDDAFLADLVHRIGDDLADGLVAVGRDRADLRDFLRGGGGLGGLLQLLDEGGDGLVDAALQVHRVHAGGHVLHAFADDGLGQHGGGGGAVTGDVAGLGSDFLDHLGAHVLELVLELDFLGDRHTVLGDGGGAEGALEDHVAALRAQGDLDCVGEDVHALDHACAGFTAEDDVFCCHVDSP